MCLVLFPRVQYSSGQAGAKVSEGLSADGDPSARSLIDPPESARSDRCFIIDDI